MLACRLATKVFMALQINSICPLPCCPGCSEVLEVDNHAKLGRASSVQDGNSHCTAGSVLRRKAGCYLKVVGAQISPSLPAGVPPESPQCFANDQRKKSRRALASTLSVPVLAVSA
jgi:hypothetical protein